MPMSWNTGLWILRRGLQLHVNVCDQALLTPTIATMLKHTFDVLKMTNRSTSFRLAPPMNSSTVEGCLEESDESTSLQ